MRIVELHVDGPSSCAIWVTVGKTDTPSRVQHKARMAVSSELLHMTLLWCCLWCCGVVVKWVIRDLECRARLAMHRAWAIFRCQGWIGVGINLLGNLPACGQTPDADDPGNQICIIC